jgi:hypothetical protein
MSSRQQRHARRDSIRLIHKFCAIAAAALLHLAIVLGIGLSLQSSELRFSVVDGGGAILASLTPAAAVSGDAAKPPANRLDQVVHNLGNDPATSVDASRSASRGNGLLAELDQSLSQASDSTSQVSSARQREPAQSPVPSLQNGGDPWSRVSALTLNTGKVRELWAAIRPCWRGHMDEGSASIRVVLGASGQVVNMTTLDDTRDQSKSSAEALATAVVACAPYRIGGPDAYLVKGPV